MIVIAIKIFSTLSTPCHVPERAVFFTQIATPRSGTSRNSLLRSPSHVPECLTAQGGRALQTIVAINVTRRARHCWVEC